MSIYPTDDRYEPSAEEARALHRDALAKKYGVRLDHPKLQVLYDLVYGHDHSISDSMLESYFMEFSVLLEDEVEPGPKAGWIIPEGFTEMITPVEGRYYILACNDDLNPYDIVTPDFNQVDEIVGWTSKVNLGRAWPYWPTIDKIIPLPAANSPEWRHPTN